MMRRAALLTALAFLACSEEFTTQSALRILPDDGGRRDVGAEASITDRSIAVDRSPAFPDAPDSAKPDAREPIDALPDRTADVTRDAPSDSAAAGGSSTGGTASTGGVAGGTGGSRATGGATQTGGAPTGGMPSTGGVLATGGAPCVPKSCTDQGLECGSATDLCGTSLHCGICSGLSCSNGRCVCIASRCPGCVGISCCVSPAQCGCTIFPGGTCS